jgi:hypothetical protein
MLVLVLAASMAVVYNISKTANNKLSDSIGEKERVLRLLDEDYARENARLVSMMTPDRLARTLRRRGMAMNVTHPHQIIKMSSSGRPYPGQMALRRINVKNSATAYYRQKLPR